MNDINKSFLTEEAKADIKEMLDIGNGGGSDSGLFVVTTITMSSEGDVGTGDMTKAEILQAFSNKKIVIALLTNERTNATGFGFLLLNEEGALLMSVMEFEGSVVSYIMLSTESDDCTTWTLLEP